MLIGLAEYDTVNPSLAFLESKTAARNSHAEISYDVFITSENT